MTTYKADFHIENRIDVRQRPNVRQQCENKNPEFPNEVNLTSGKYGPTCAYSGGLPPHTGVATPVQQFVVGHSPHFAWFDKVLIRTL
jgi:hypothetical protein